MTLLRSLAQMVSQLLTTVLSPLNNVGPLSVLSPLEISHRFHIPVDCSLPDHSVLLWSIKLDSQPTFNQPQNPYTPQTQSVSLKSHSIKNAATHWWNPIDLIS